MADRVVVINGTRSDLLAGDVDETRLSGTALPVLLAEGWRVIQLVAGGDKGCYALLRQGLAATEVAKAVSSGLAEGAVSGAMGGMGMDM